MSEQLKPSVVKEIVTKVGEVGGIVSGLIYLLKGSLTGAVAGGVIALASHWIRSHQS